MSQLTEVFNEQLKAINQYNERRFVMMILDKTKEATEKTFLTDSPDLENLDMKNAQSSEGKTLLCDPLDAPYRPGANARREDAERTNALSESGGSGGGNGLKERAKHFDILDAMVHLERTAFIVQKLCDDIVGVVRPNVPTIDEEPVKEPSLLDVLERTPGNIHAGCNMIEETVKEIRAQIL